MSAVPIDSSPLLEVIKNGSKEDLSKLIAESKDFGVGSLSYGGENRFNNVVSAIFEKNALAAIEAECKKEPFTDKAKLVIDFLAEENQKGTMGSERDDGSWEPLNIQDSLKNLNSSCPNLTSMVDEKIKVLVAEKEQKPSNVLDYKDVARMPPEEIAMLQNLGKALVSPAASPTKKGEGSGVFANFTKHFSFGSGRKNSAARKGSNEETPLLH